MEWLQKTLIDDPLYAYLTLGLIEIALAGWWHERRTRRLALSLVAPPILAVAILLAGMLVPTDRKAILAAAKAVATGIEEDKIAPLEQFLDGDFAGYYQGAALDKNGAITTARAVKMSHQITRIDLGSAEVEVAGKRATMTVTTSMRLSDSAMGDFDVRVTFKLTWVKRPAGWRLLEAAEPQVQR